MKKKAFPKKYVDIDIKDLGFFKYADDGIAFRFWSDPSQEVIYTLMKTTIFATKEEVIAMNDEEKERLNRSFMECATELIIDCNIEGLSFNTPEETEESFYHPALPWSFLFEIIQQYIIRLMTEHNRLKKTLSRLAETASSGENKNKKE